MDVVDEKRTRRKARKHALDRAAVDARLGKRPFETFDDSRFVPLGLEAPDEPRSAIGEPFVVEVDGVLRRQQNS